MMAGKGRESCQALPLARLFLSLVIIFLSLLPVTRSSAQPSADGQWSPVINWPIQAIHSAMLPTGKVLVWQSWMESVGLWDPITEQFSQPALPDINVFCSSHAWLPDGQLMVVGGHIANNVGESAANIYDPFTDTWADNVAPMNAGRWYPSATTLGDGTILTMSGDMNFAGDANLLPQIYDAQTNSWRDLTTAQKQLPLYPRTFLAPDGAVVSLSNYNDTTDRLDTTGTGQWSYVDQTLDNNLHNYGPAVMYDAGKVAYIGGGNNPTANISLIDLGESSPSWRYGADSMAQPRRQNDATILADGTVLITGGSSVTGWNDPNGRISVAEIWDPVTEQVTQVAAASDVYRGYHTTATLLPDGRVLITGGDHDHDGDYVSNRNAEIYSPAYLFNGPRPEITAAPESANLGSTFFVGTADAASIADVTFIVPGATTHAQNWTQRANHLEFTEVTGGLDISLPANPNEAPPGYYMLFLINNLGVPSVAEFIRADLVTAQPGDFDNDGILGCSDVDALVAVVATLTHNSAYDLDGNGLVNQADLTQWLALAGAANLPGGGAILPGDANLDGAVDGRDLLIWNRHKFEATFAWCGADFNADGSTNAADFQIWNANKFQTSAGQSIPEPATASVFMLVLVAACGAARIRRRGTVV